jgi:hypothetical protein
MGAVPLTRAIGARLRRAGRRLTGVRAQGVHLVTTANAAAIAQGYPGVAFDTLVEDGPATALEPRCLPGDELPALAPFRPTLETVLFDIERPDFSFRSNLLFDGQMRAFYPDIAAPAQVLAFREYVPRRCRRLRGTVAYLSNTWVDNYYHWLQLTLPLLRVYRRLRPDVRIDYYYIGESRLLDLQADTLARLDIERAQIVTAPCRADRLLVACSRHPAQHGGYHYRDAAGHGFVRGLFVPPAHPAHDLPSRIFVSRGRAATRALLNEAEVMARLAPLGFVAVQMEGRPAAEQAALFWHAEAIVAPHGAALGNLVFARPDTIVIEIFPHGRQEPSMFAAATHSRLRYFYLRGRAPDARARGRRREDTVVEPEKLDRLVAIAGLKPRVG